MARAGQESPEPRWLEFLHSKAESVFYWIRQEKRKRRDAIVKLEAQIKAKIVDKNNYFDHPPLPIKNAIIDLQINTTETILMDSKGLLKFVDDNGDGDNEVRYDNANDDELWKWWNAEYENELGAQSNHRESNIFSHAMGGVSTVHQIDEIQNFKIVYFCFVFNNRRRRQENIRKK